MYKFLFFPVFCFLLISEVFSQERCASALLDSHLKKKYPQIGIAREQFEQLLQLHSSSNARLAVSDSFIYKISVVVHVIHKNSTGTIGGTGNTNISDAQILSQIDVLNEDYRRKAGTNGFNSNAVGADTRIEFCLAIRDSLGAPTSGIVRKYNSKSTWHPTNDDDELKSLSHWPADKYLNLYVTDLTSPYLGYAHFPYDSDVPGIPGSDSGPATDGVIIDYTAFGRIGTVKSPYHLGRTATHEIGHWLGLLHIWGDSFCGDDYVEDTPPDAAPNNSAKNCADSSKCTGSKYVKDLSNDFLDYSPDVCMNLFTKGQKDRMRTVLELSDMRKSAVEHPACEDPAAVRASEINSNHIKVFPNPSSGMIFYELDFTGEREVSIQIRDVLGQVVYLEKRKNSLKFKNEINLSSLPKGVYLLMSQIDASTEVLKLMIEN